MTRKEQIAISNARHYEKRKRTPSQIAKRSEDEQRMRDSTRLPEKVTMRTDWIDCKQDAAEVAAIVGRGR